MEGFKQNMKMMAKGGHCYKSGGHVTNKKAGGKMKKAMGGKMGVTDKAEDKAIVKKAIRLHDKNMHEGKTEDLSTLKKGGMAKKMAKKHGGMAMKAGGGPMMKAGGMAMKSGGMAKKHGGKVMKANGGPMMEAGGRAMPKKTSAPTAGKKMPAKKAKAPVMKKKSSMAKSSESEVPVLGSPDAMESMVPPAGAMPMMKHGGVVEHRHYAMGGDVAPMGAGMMGAGMAGAPGAMGAMADPRLMAAKRRLAMLGAQGGAGPAAAGATMGAGAPAGGAPAAPMAPQMGGMGA